MTNSNRADFQAAKLLFRNKHPVQALELARAVLQRDPEAEGVARFIQAVLANVNAQIKLAARAGDHATVIRLATLLIFEPDFANGVESALLASLRESLSGLERGVFLLELSHKIALPEIYWQEIGAVLGDLPVSMAQVETGFDILRHIPGDEPTFWALSNHLAALGLPAKADPTVVSTMFTALRDRFDSFADVVMDKAARATVYAELYDDAMPYALDDYPARLSREQAICHSEYTFRPKATKDSLPENVWSLLDVNSEQYVLRADPSMSSATATLFAEAAPFSARHSQIFFLRAKIILSLWLRAINYEASHDRIGYIWLVLDPLIHVLIICIVPLFLHADQVADMNTFPFAVIGACFWLTFRTASTGALSGGGVLKPQLEHPAIRRFDIVVARALSGIIVYFFVGGALLIVTGFLGMTSFPVNFPKFILCFAIIWIFGTSYGIIINSLVMKYPGMRRINGVLIRLIALTSGLFYVSEQMPDSVSSFLLWNPLLHIIQLARSYWFYEYTTRDAEPTYVFYWLLALVVLALGCTILDERRVESVRA